MFVTNFSDICFPSYVFSRASRPTVGSREQVLLAEVARASFSTPASVLGPLTATLSSPCPQHQGQILPRSVLLPVGSEKRCREVAHNI